MSKITDVLLRSLTNDYLTAKGSKLTSTEFDDNYVALFEFLRQILYGQDGLEEYSPAYSYFYNHLCIYVNTIYISIFDGENLNHTPGVTGSETYWQVITVEKLFNLLTIKRVTDDYTLLPDDNNKYIEVQTKKNIIITLPLNLPVGFHCKIEQIDSGYCTINALTENVHINSFGSLVQSQLYATIDIVKKTGNNYNVTGNLTS